MERSNAKHGSSGPSQPVRLLWFLFIFVPPWAAVGYVQMYAISHGSGEAMVHVLSILALSMAVSLICAIAQPIQVFNEASITNAARFNLCIAIIDTIILVILINDPSSAGQAGRMYPVGWLSLAGMHYCYAVWAYTTVLISSR